MRLKIKRNTEIRRSNINNYSVLTVLLPDRQEAVFSAPQLVYSSYFSHVKKSKHAKQRRKIGFLWFPCLFRRYLNSFQFHKLFLTVLYFLIKFMKKLKTKIKISAVFQFFGLRPRSFVLLIVWEKSHVR